MNFHLPLLLRHRQTQVYSFVGKSPHGPCKKLNLDDLGLEIEQPNINIYFLEKTHGIYPFTHPPIHPSIHPSIHPFWVNQNLMILLAPVMWGHLWKDSPCLRSVVFLPCSTQLPKSEVPRRPRKEMWKAHQLKAPWPSTQLINQVPWQRNPPPCGICRSKSSSCT